ncbi:MAG: ribosome maturation factor RimP [Clostridia bacterium]|nr:ribosome maturation factor RimP [Clostridia bacterium]
MAGNHKNIADTVWELILPTVLEQGCSLWDVEYVKEGARRILRITIDREEGVDIERCEAVHRAIDPLLDEADPIPDAYYLEVSSPGVEREIRRPFHYEVMKGLAVDVKLFTAVDGVKQISGVLEAYDAEADTVTVGGHVLPLEKVSKMNQHFDFE